MNLRKTVSSLFLCGMSVIAMQCVAGVVSRQDDGLVGLWKFEDGSGAAVKDTSASHNDGAIKGAGASVRGRGEFAGSISLTGANNNHVQIPASASLNRLTKHLTVIAQIYPRTLWFRRPSWAFWMDKPQGTGFIAVVQRQWRDVLHPDLYYLGFGRKKGVLNYKWHLGLIQEKKHDESLYCLPDSGDIPAVGQWVHLAGSYDGDTGKMTLYVNGTPICSRTTAGMINLDAESLERPLIIGAELNGPDINNTENGFDGYIDEVRIYARALSDAEIRTLADAAKKSE